MIEDKLQKIEDKIRQSQNMHDDNKQALLQLLSELKTEINLAPTELGDGLQQDISRIDHQNEGIIKAAFTEINETINHLEETHPRLVQLTNSICTHLSNSGF